MADYQKKSTNLGVSFTNDLLPTISVVPWTISNGLSTITCKKIPITLTNDVYMLSCNVTNRNNASNTRTNPIKVRIILTNMDESSSQVIEFPTTIPIGQTKHFEVVFQQNAPIGYNGIYFQITDGMGDITSSDDVLDIVIDRFCTVNEVSLLKGVKRLGVQGPPHMWVVLNDQGLRINHSGVFELMSEDLDINFVGFIPQTDDDFFLVDYTI